LQKLLITVTLACAAQFAHAAEAGKIIFVAGAAQVGARAATEGAQVQEGQMLSTGADGYIYVKTADNGLFILRPNTKARIVDYRIDAQNPANTKVKFELISGTARSKSGDAVKQARQNFRFNTPVAAIGVRGTDFTVVTDDDTSRVSVFSGGVIVSGFVGGCRPDGGGPCEGVTSRELSAAQRGQLVQVTRGQAAPQVMEAGAAGPEQASPPRQDEPLVRNGESEGDSGRPSLEAQKIAQLSTALENALPVNPPVVVAPDLPSITPPVVANPNPVPESEPVVVSPQLPDAKIVWGRWQVVSGLPPKLILSMAQNNSELLAINGNYVLLRTPGQGEYIAPNNGSIGFKLRESEAFVYTDYTPTYRVATTASLKNGELTVDFGSKSFSTGVDMVSSTGNARLTAGGQVGKDGRLYGDGASGRIGVMNVQGLLSNQDGGSAAYIFDSRLDERRTVNGVTYWKK